MGEDAGDANRDGTEQRHETRKPGEQPPGKFHYNPGNMAGKTVNDATPANGARTNSDARVADLEAEKRARQARRGDATKG